MRSIRDGSAFWNIEPDVRDDGEIPSLHGICPLFVTANAMGDYTPEPFQTTLTLACRCTEVSRNNSAYCSLRLGFTLNAPFERAIREGSGEYHVLASCANVGMHLVEQHLLTQEQLPGFWQMIEGTWEDRYILRPDENDAGALLYPLQAFGFGQVTEEGIRRALEIRSMVTGCVKWCGLAAKTEFGVPVKQVAQALVNRGHMKARSGDSAGAISDYTDAIQSPNPPVDQVAKALVNRGNVRHKSDDNAGAITDYTALIELPSAPVDQVARAFVNRGDMKRLSGDSAEAIIDYTAAIEQPNAPASQVARALGNRGDMKRQSGDGAGAIFDYTAAIELPGAPVDVIARSLAHRGYTYETFLKNNEKALKDYLISAERGDPWAQNLVGWWYLNGIEVTKSLANAEHYFLLAAAQGNEDAKTNLRLYFSSKESGLN
jgi:tetratricopeptide (TPR) repeat protein